MPRISACLVPQEQVTAVAAGRHELVLGACEGDALDRLRVAVPCAHSCQLCWNLLNLIVLFLISILVGV